MTSEELRAAFKYLFPKELPALKWLANQLPSEPIVVNIGAGSGTSGLAFLESRPDLTLITVDVEDQDSPFGSLYSEKQAVRAAGLGHLLNRFWFQVCKDSKEFAKEYSIRMKWNVERIMSFKPVDLVFVDGDHSYEGCKGDIEGWLPCIKSGGFMAVHDYQKERLFHEGDSQEFLDDRPHPKPWPGVNQAVDELLLTHYELYMQVDSLVVFRI